MQPEQRIAGHWRINLPDSDAIVQVRCFTDPAAGSSLSGDPLSYACDTINRFRGEENDDEPGELDPAQLQACATLARTRNPPRSNEARRRVLWAFWTTPEAATHINLVTSSLSEITVPITEFRPSSMLPCPLGHQSCKLSCRSSPLWSRPALEEDARLLFAAETPNTGDDTDESVHQVWNQLACAIAQRMALRCESQLPWTTCEDRYRLSLFTISPMALCLSARAVQPEVEHRQEELRAPQNKQVRLRPLGIRAVRLSPYPLAPEKSQQLACQFRSFLHITPAATNIEWSVFWVSLHSLGWQLESPFGAQRGVFALWPDAFVDYSVRQTYFGGATDPWRPCGADDLASEGFSLFDSLSRKQMTPQRDPSDPAPGTDVEETAAIAMLVADESGDDLFSVTSSPAQSPKTSSHPSAVKQSSPLHHSDRIRSTSHASPAHTPALSPRQSEVIIDPITEMDFDFFDAPTPVGQSVPQSKQLQSPTACVDPLLDTASSPQNFVDYRLSTQGHPSADMRADHLASQHESLEAYPKDRAPEQLALRPEQHSLFRQAPPEPTLFAAVALPSRVYQPRYGHQPWKPVAGAGLSLTSRLKAAIASTNDVPPDHPWQRTARQMPLPREATARPSPSMPRHDGMYSPPASPPLIVETCVTPLRYNGFRCLTIELLLGAGSQLADTDIDTLPDLGVGREAADICQEGNHFIGAPISPPLSPASAPAAAIAALQDRNIHLLVQEIICNRNFSRLPTYARRSMTWSDDVLHHFPRPVSLQDLGVGLDEVNAPAVRTRRRTMSSTRQRPEWSMTCQLKAPRLTLAYLGDVITVTAESIQFWRELGVGPVNGAKDVTYFLVAFEDGPGLKLVPSVAETYQALGFGLHVPGNVTGQGDEVTVNRSSWRDSLYRIGSQAVTTPYTVIYVELPSQDTLEVAGAILNHVASISEPHSSQVAIHMICPWVIDDPQAAESTAFDVYNRLQAKTPGVVSRSCSTAGGVYSSPAYTLSSPMKDPISFSMRWPATTHDVARASSHVHCAYHWCETSRTLLACCIDAHGVPMAVNAWQLHLEQHEPAEVIAKLHRFATSAAGPGRRVRFCCKGAPNALWLRAWHDFLERQSSADTELFCVTTELDISNDKSHASESTAPSIFSTPSAKLHSDSLAGFVVYLPYRTALAIRGDRSSTTTLSALASFVILMGSQQGGESRDCLTVHLLAASTQAYAEAEERLKLAESFHHLCVLTKLRCGTRSVPEPLHVHLVTQAAGCVQPREDHA